MFVPSGTERPQSRRFESVNRPNVTCVSDMTADCHGLIKELA
jgi:hypothetical protein